MSNTTNNMDENDVYVDNPDHGRSREQVSGSESRQYSNTTDDAPDQLTASSTREQALQASAQQGQGPISSGQQSSGSSDSSGVGGYGQPESGYGPDAQGGSTDTQSGYNQAGYNEQGTYSTAQGDTQPQNDGLQDTMGSTYDSQNQGANPGMAQDGYDPDKSGVRPAQNNPGEVVDTPGRDVGSSWGMDEQMGSSSDTPDRSNPGA